MFFNNTLIINRVIQTIWLFSGMFADSINLKFHPASCNVLYNNYSYAHGYDQGGIKLACMHACVIDLLFSHGFYFTITELSWHGLRTYIHTSAKCNTCAPMYLHCPYNIILLWRCNSLVLGIIYNKNTNSFLRATTITIKKTTKWKQCKG